MVKINKNVSAPDGLVREGLKSHLVHSRARSNIFLE